MSSMGERYQKSLEENLKARIDGPLVVATIGSPVGSMSNFFKAEAFDLAMGSGDGQASKSTRGEVHQNGAKDIRLPQSFAVALTPTTVYFFKWKPFWGRSKIKKQIACISRDGLVVRIRKGKASATVFALLSEPSGVRTAFEMATLGMSSAKAKVAEVVAAFAPESGSDVSNAPNESM